MYPCGLIVLPRRDHLFGPQVVCVCISAELEEAGHACQSLLEGIEVFRGAAPLHLAERRHTRKAIVFHGLRASQIFCPHVGLHSEDVALRIFGHAFGERFVTVNLLHVYESVTG